MGPGCLRILKLRPLLSPQLCARLHEGRRLERRGGQCSDPVCVRTSAICHLVYIESFSILLCNKKGFPKCSLVQCVLALGAEQRFALIFLL